MILVNTKEVTVTLRKIKPEQGKYLKNIETNDVFDGIVYLGKYDSAENYIEITKEEYDSRIKEIEQQNEQQNI